MVRLAAKDILFPGAVGDERKKLIRIITRKSVINAITEIGVWPDIDFRKWAA